MENQEAKNEALIGGSGLNAELGLPLNEVTDIEQLRTAVEFLWALIDDIDTASDMAKENDKWYRARVEEIQKKRFQKVTSDGYGLFMPNI